MVSRLFGKLDAMRQRMVGPSAAASGEDRVASAPAPAPLRRSRRFISYRSSGNDRHCARKRGLGQTGGAFAGNGGAARAVDRHLVAAGGLGGPPGTVGTAEQLFEVFARVYFHHPEAHGGLERLAVC